MLLKFFHKIGDLWFILCKQLESLQFQSKCILGFRLIFRQGSNNKSSIFAQGFLYTNFQPLGAVLEWANEPRTTRKSVMTSTAAVLSILFEFPGKVVCCLIHCRAVDCLCSNRSGVLCPTQIRGLHMRTAVPTYLESIVHGIHIGAFQRHGVDFQWL